jgi:D-glycerate 3-kinase
MISTHDRSWIDELRRAQQLPASYLLSVPDYVAPVAQRIQALYAFHGRPVVIGINGAQGSGKSTFALFLATWLQQELGFKSACLSLDDLYLGKQERTDLAKCRHPLLRTRGVPGTHDVALGIATLDALTAKGKVQHVTLPAFDKGRDDRINAAELHDVLAPVDVVLFEGWCVGARPQTDRQLTEPVNELEREEDPDGTWRAYANTQLGSEYAGLFMRLDALIMLRIPSFDKVLEWRELQERKQRADTGMSPDELRHFIMHFERLTRHMLEDMPDYADVVIDIDESHRMVGIYHNKWSFEDIAS